MSRKFRRLGALLGVLVANSCITVEEANFYFAAGSMDAVPLVNGSNP